MPSSLRSRWFPLPLLLVCLLLTNSITQTALHAAPGTPPILLVVNSADNATKPFDAYLGEMLRTEGWNSYDEVQLSTVTSVASLSDYQVVILADTALSAAQSATITSFVNGGGRLLAMRPDPKLAPTLGLNALGTTQSDGYLKIDTTTNGGAGLPNVTLQIHGTSDRYMLNGATTVAQLYSNATTPTSNPAVVINNVGANGGKAAAFSYDLARNVALTRQGDPLNGTYTHPTSGRMGDTDGDGVARTVDMFQSRPAGGTPWVDRNNIPIPQADEHMRLMSHVIEDLTNDQLPLPRLWYFPDNAMTMLIPTGDAHANEMHRYDRVLDSMNAHGGKITLYLSKGGGIETADAQMQEWRAQGHEFGVHPYWWKPDNYPAPITNLQEGYDDYTGLDGTDGWYAERFRSPKSPTTRNHQVAWEGWTTAAEIEAAHGIRMDTNFYTWGAWLEKSDGTWPHGYVNGSGQPMKFIASDGTLINNYQQVTQLIDEQLLGSINPDFENLDGAGATQVSKTLIDASLAGDYAALMTQFHVDYYGHGSPQEWAEATMDYATSKGVPIWNADGWLYFTETRHDANFEQIAWNAGTGKLTFNLVNPTATTSAKLTLMLPSSIASGTLQTIAVDGVNTTFTTKMIKGRTYALFLVNPGTRAIAAQYLSGPKTPVVTNAATNEDTLNTSGLVITRGTGDSAATHFKISGITNGVLYKHDGTTVIGDGGFITVAEGSAGLKFRPALDSVVNGSFSVRAALDASDATLSSGAATATISVASVNDAPQFALPTTSVTVDEDTGAQALTGFAATILPSAATATNETGQTLTFDLTMQAITGNLAFTSAPTLDAAGTLRFTTAPNTNGTATVSVVLRDNGSGSAPNDNTSDAQLFSIVVTPTNDTPEFTLPDTTLTTVEDAGIQKMDGFATSIRTGPQTATDENEQPLTFAVALENTTGGLAFATAPTLSADGTLSFATTTDTNGTATVAVTLSDGAATSATQRFTVIVNDVNDAPRFDAAPSIAVRYNAGAQTFSRWAVEMQPAPEGATDEIGQQMHFETSILSTTGTLIFTVTPMVDADGVLTFAAANGTSGTANVQITLHDDGGTSNGGVDRSATHTLTITVNPPGTVSGIVFHDRNADGALDGGDAGLGGVIVTLSDSNGSDVTQMTKPDGTYSMTVAPGTYTLAQTQLNGYGSSTPNTLTMIVPVEGIANQNFGETTGSISGSVYVDTNTNSVRDVGEMGIMGVAITLTGTDVNNATVARTSVTAADGSYQFDELLAGAYTVAAMQAVGYNDGQEAAGTAGGVASNDVIANIVIGSGGRVSGYTFGEVVPLSTSTPTPSPTPSPTLVPTPSPTLVPTLVPTPTTSPVPADKTFRVYAPLTMGASRN